MKIVSVNAAHGLEHRVRLAKTWCALIPLLFALAAISGCSALTSGKSAQNTVPGGQTYAISGTISPTAGGTGATLTLSGVTTGSTTADSAGNYTFNGLANGTYVVAPSHAGYAFTPATQAVTVSGATVTGVNFTAASQPTFSISGTISPTAGGVSSTVTL